MMRKSALSIKIKAYCKKQDIDLESFASECGITVRHLYRVLKTGKLSDNLAINIGEKLCIAPHLVRLFLSDPYEDFKIKHRDDETKPQKSVAGKICWNPTLKNWEYQIMLYNKQTDPPDLTHPVWGSIRKHQFPKREGTVPWETFSYLLFTIDEN